MDRDWTVSFPIRFRNGTCIIILDKKYNIANSSCHFGSYGSIWTGPSPKKYYMDLRSFDPYNIFLMTDRSIYFHMTLSAMNYLLYIHFSKVTWLEHWTINNFNGQYLKTLWIRTKEYFNSIGIQFHRKGSNYYTGKEKKINC